MASPSEAAPALVKLIIVINYSGTLERARVCGTRANMHVGARAHTPRQAGQSSGREATLSSSAPPPRKWNSVNEHVHGGEENHNIRRGPLGSRFIWSNAASSIVLQR